MLNDNDDVSMASAGSYFRTCRRIRKSKKIATIRDFHLYICINPTHLFQSIFVIGLGSVTRNLGCQSLEDGRKVNLKFEVRQNIVFRSWANIKFSIFSNTDEPSLYVICKLVVFVSIS